MFDSRRQIRNIAGSEINHLLIGFARVHLDHGGIATHHVAQGANRQRQVFVNHTAWRHGFGVLEQRSPKLRQKRTVALELGFVHPFGRGTDDAATGSVFFATGFEQIFQAFALDLVLDLDRDSDNRRIGHVNQVTRRYRDTGRQARALGSHRVLDYLHQQGLAFTQQLIDCGAAGIIGLFFVIITYVDIRYVQKARFFQSYVDKSRLHAGQHTIDLALVDIADNAPAALAFDRDFL